MTVDMIGVVGLGMLGRGIAACLLANGFRVLGYTQGEVDSHARARKYIGDAIEELFAHDEHPCPDWAERYVEVESFAQLSPADFVIESVVEDFDTKQQVFDEIEDAVGIGVPIASNTSAIPISLLQEPRRHPERFVGMHWAEPAYATRFLELIRGKHTSDMVMETVAALGRRVGKDPCFVQKDVPGSVVNRLGYAMYREAVHLLESGVADVETIDRCFRNAVGLWASFCGPFRWMDITGGPASYAKVMQGVLPSLAKQTEIPETLDRMLKDDARGVINGQGFYSYGPGDAERWEALMHEQAWAVRKLAKT